jgi:hypothetical protein
MQPARERGANKPKSIQAKPNKSKQKSLDLLGVIRPNRAFSMGCGRKNKKNPTSPSGRDRDALSPVSPVKQRARPWAAALAGQGWIRPIRRG